MSDWNEGDLVEAVKGESMVRGRLRRGTFIGTECYMYVGDHGDLQSQYIDRGWTVSVIERTKVEMPTEPGLYRLSNDMVVEWTGRKWLSPNHMNYVTLYAEQSLSFTRLEPVPVTAKKVLDRVSQILPGPFPNEFSGLGREFGVQS